MRRLDVAAVAATRHPQCTRSGTACSRPAPSALLDHAQHVLQPEPGRIARVDLGLGAARIEPRVLAACRSAAHTRRATVGDALLAVAALRDAEQPPGAGIGRLALHRLLELRDRLGIGLRRCRSRSAPGPGRPQQRRVRRAAAPPRDRARSLPRCGRSRTASGPSARGSTGRPGARRSARRSPLERLRQVRQPVIGDRAGIAAEQRCRSPCSAAAPRADRAGRPPAWRPCGACASAQAGGESRTPGLAPRPGSRRTECGRGSADGSAGTGCLRDDARSSGSPGRGRTRARPAAEMPAREIGHAGLVGRLLLAAAEAHQAALRHGLAAGDDRRAELAARRPRRPRRPARRPRIISAGRSRCACADAAEMAARDVAGLVRDHAGQLARVLGRA